MRAPDKPTIRRSRGRPRMNPVDRTENPAFVAASEARAIIDYRWPREEMKKRVRAMIEDCKARGDDPWPLVDYLTSMENHRRHDGVDRRAARGGAYEAQASSPEDARIRGA